MCCWIMPAFPTASIKPGRGNILGAPVPGATMATVNFAHVVTAVEFVVAEIVEPPDEKALMHRDEIDAGRAPLDPLAEPLERRFGA